MPYRDGNFITGTRSAQEGNELFAQIWDASRRARDSNEDFMRELGWNETSSESVLHRIFSDKSTCFALMVYFFSAYKPEYINNPITENQLLEPRNLGNLEVVLKDCVDKVRSPDIWEVLIIGSSPGKTFTERDFAINLIKSLVSRLCSTSRRHPYPHGFQAALPKNKRVMCRRLVHFVGWFRKELSPERWQYSILPILLGLREKDKPGQSEALSSHNPG